MNLSKQQVVGLVVALLLIVGGVLAFTRLQNGDENGDQQAAEQTDNDYEELARATEAMSDASFIATITGDSTEGPINVTMEQDGQGSSRFVTEQNGTTLQFIITPDAAYSCENDDCMQFASEDVEGSFFEPDDFVYSEDDMDVLQANATFAGQEECPAGTCNVWEVTEGADTSRIYISTSDNTISQVSVTGPEGSFNITYDYQDVTITPPENAEVMPVFGNGVTN